MIRLTLLMIYLHLCYGAVGEVSFTRIFFNQWKTVPLTAGIVRVEMENFDSSYSSAIIQVTALKQICVSSIPKCMSGSSYLGKSVGIQQVYYSEIIKPPFVYIISNISQKAFIYIRGYRYAPIVGACPRPIPRFQPINPTLETNPNLHVDQSSAFFNNLSFAYSSMMPPTRGRTVLSCNEKSFWSKLVYEIYVLPWNQRYIVSNPNFNHSSRYPLAQTLYRATSDEVLRYGSMIYSLKMNSLSIPNIRISKRLGMDVIVSVLVRIVDDDVEDESGNELKAYYISQNVHGCTADDSKCAIIASIWAKIVVGVMAIFCFFFSHLGRRVHRLNTFFSGYAIGSIVTFSLLSNLTKLDPVITASISLIGGGLGFGLVVMFLFWKAKPSNKLSHVPLYLTASFLISATVFFTPLGNQPFWSSYELFWGCFCGIIAAFALFIFLPFTEKFSVDLCTALVGSYAFLFGAMVVFVPGSVFPYLFLDSLYRISVPGAHNSLSISWTGMADIAAFIVWPSLVFFVFLINHFCSPALSQPRREVVMEAAGDTTSGSHSASPNRTAPDAWPPLPPAAYVSERTPLISTSADLHLQGTPTAPPPYMEVSDDRPPSYHP